MRTALISLVLAVVGVGAIVAVASTTGPPDGYARFSSGDVHVYRPLALTEVASGGSSVVLNARGAPGAVRVITMPSKGRPLDPVAREALAQAGGGRIASDEKVDVTGADDAREIVSDDPERKVRRTVLVAQQDDRLYVLNVSVRRTTPENVLDGKTVVDSFYLD
jgi:hypothetical protein